MIPRFRPLTVLLATAAFSCIPPGCGESTEPDRPPRDARSEGPELDVAMLDDPAVQAFAADAATFLELTRRIAPLEQGLAAGTLSEEDTATWRELDARVAAERGRLNALLYADGVSAEQRAAMWWVLRGRTADHATVDSGDATAPSSPDA